MTVTCDKGQEERSYVGYLLRRYASPPSAFLHRYIYAKRRVIRMCTILAKRRATEGKTQATFKLSGTRLLQMTCSDTAFDLDRVVGHSTLQRIRCKLQPISTELNS